MNSWADATLMELRMSYVWLPNIQDVSTVTFTVADGTQYRFDVEQVLNEEDSPRMIPPTIWRSPMAMARRCD